MKKNIYKWINQWKNNRLRRKTLSTSKKKEYHQENIELSLANLNIYLYRQSTIDTPNEITVVVPRVEIREKCFNKGCTQTQKEVIFNSITVVSAPRHPLAAPNNNNTTRELTDRINNSS